VVHNGLNLQCYFDEVIVRFPKVNPDYDTEEYRKDRSTRERIMRGPNAGNRPLEADEI
jgi:hypothetical protein